MTQDIATDSQAVRETDWIPAFAGMTEGGLDDYGRLENRNRIRLDCHLHF